VHHSHSSNGKPLKNIIDKGRRWMREHSISHPVVLSQEGEKEEEYPAPPEASAEVITNNDLEGSLQNN